MTGDQDPRAFPHGCPDSGYLGFSKRRGVRRIEQGKSVHPDLSAFQHERHHFGHRYILEHGCKPLLDKSGNCGICLPKDCRMGVVCRHPLEPEKER